jgi:hypothetical protein
LGPGVSCAVDHARRSENARVVLRVDLDRADEISGEAA